MGLWIDTMATKRTTDNDIRRHGPVIRDRLSSGKSISADDRKLLVYIIDNYLPRTVGRPSGHVNTPRANAARWAASQLLSRLAALEVYNRVPKHVRDPIMQDLVERANITYKLTGKDKLDSAYVMVKVKQMRKEGITE